ncbi:MAG: FAD-dependent oxidoreductase [Planctomycetes bacterium]|nr:FAD-dependent oxidoreductase [Planctomycetota bacterium]
MKIAIVGGGVFGLAAAWRLAIRGHAVEVLEADHIPARKAASRDISKAFRGGYGVATPEYAPGVARARELWRDLETQTGRAIYHETGCLQICTRFDPGDFEREGFEALRGMGWPVNWLETEEIAQRYPAFRLHEVVGAVMDSWGGWIDPMQALPALAEAAEALGGRVRTSRPVSHLGDVDADLVVVCAGAWLARVVPSLVSSVRTTRQHEAFYRPLSLGDCATLPAWSLDMGTEGWYGFPASFDGVVKVARHLPDVDGNPDGGREADAEQAGIVRAFVADRLPELAQAPDEGGTCFYTMSRDGSFLFDRAPGSDRVFIAGCGGGHAFKFGPMLGEWAADLVEGRPLPAGFGLRDKGSERVV